MDEILEDPEWTVREGLALNQECPTEILGGFLKINLGKFEEWLCEIPKHPKVHFGC